MRTISLLLLSVSLVAQKPEATSLLGKPLFALPPPPANAARMEADLAAARAVWEKDRSNADAIIWLGRRTAYVGRFRDAIAIYTDGIKQHPTDARFLRHRGHRYISVREFDRAIADLEKAAALRKGKADEVEPDGQPNARNIPTSTLHSNIWYHLALAHYLKGDFDRAIPAWRTTRDVGKNPDNLVSATHWLYTSLRRAGKTAEAADALKPIRADLEVIENMSYHALCLLYKGERTVEDVLKSAPEGPSGSAIRYGVSIWHVYNGRDAEARKLWESLTSGPDWPSFGYIGAEAELARKR
jgi:tetratricopeptide (TPR) repeat protein